MYLLSGVEVSVSVPTVRCRGLCKCTYCQVSRSLYVYLLSGVEVSVSVSTVRCRGLCKCTYCQVSRSL